MLIAKIALFQRFYRRYEAASMNVSKYGMVRPSAWSVRGSPGLTFCRLWLPVRRLIP